MAQRRVLSTSPRADARSLMVRNVAPDVSETQLRQVFARHGELQTLQMNNVAHGVVVVSYFDLRSVSAAGARALALEPDGLTRARIGAFGAGAARQPAARSRARRAPLVPRQQHHGTRRATDADSAAVNVSALAHPLADAACRSASSHSWRSDDDERVLLRGSSCPDGCEGVFLFCFAAGVA